MSFDLFGMLEQSQATGLPFGGGLNSAGMADKQRRNTRSGLPRPNPAPRQSQPMSARQSLGADPMAAFMLANHLAQSERLSKVTNDAIQDEMDRRVAISREQRRMAHELEKKRMEEETKRREIAAQHDALLKRLQAESGIVTVYH